MTQGFIYCITNKINGKQYIGQTIQNPDTRWYQHKNSAKNNSHDYYLYRSMNKYGIENFFFEIIEKCNKEELSNKEKEYIKKYNTYRYSPNSNGYNLTLGGEGYHTRNFDELEIVEKYQIQQSIEELATEYNCSKWTIHNILQKHGITRTATSNKFTDEEIENIIQDYKLCKSTYTVAKKYGCSADTIQKILKKKRIKKDGNGRSRKIQIEELNLTFDSINQAANFLVENQYSTSKPASAATMIRRQLNGERQSKLLYGFTINEVNVEI